MRIEGTLTLKRKTKNGERFLVRAQKEQLRTQLEFKVQEKGPQVQVRIRIQSQTAGQLKKKKMLQERNSNRLKINASGPTLKK